ncbi:MAG: hypothetical protein RMJ15_04845 [Nitrososphaerota archaeon]|nr:hypothetical protein [Nitrososphaerota archaeon]
MRNYIFTVKELQAVEQFTQTGKRNPTVNKLIHYIKNNDRLFNEIQIFLELWSRAHYKPAKAKPKLPYGRPPKIFKKV